MYDTFLLHVQQLYDNNFPLQDVKCRYDKCKSPWLLSVGKAPGSDGVSSSVIKQARYSLAKPLADIFNKCLTAGVFHDSLKIAQVTPIYKNYRPISVLSTF